MSLVFSALVPHPPFLLPSIPKNSGPKSIHLQKTIDALKEIESRLYRSRPDIVIIISSHGSSFDQSATVQSAQNFHASFESFGDLSTHVTVTGNIEIPMMIKNHGEANGVSLFLSSDQNIDYGIGIPIIFLFSHLPSISLIPVCPSNLSFKTQRVFGKLIREVIEQGSKRIAVIASADLSHRLSKDGPNGFSPIAFKETQTLLNNLQQQRFDNIFSLREKTVSEFNDCGFRSLLILLGVLNNTRVSPELLSFESPVGVGYAVMDFTLS